MEGSKLPFYNNEAWIGLNKCLGRLTRTFSFSRLSNLKIENLWTMDKYKLTSWLGNLRGTYFTSQLGQFVDIDEKSCEAWQDGEP